MGVGNVMWFRFGVFRRNIIAIIIHINIVFIHFKMYNSM